MNHMPRLYLDQNALIRLGRKSPDSAEVTQRIADGGLTLVLSPAHWLDIAGGVIYDASRELARSMDGLRPMWLRERTKLFRLECQEFLEGAQFEKVTQRAVCRSVADLVADIGGLDGGGAPIIDSEAMVMNLRRDQNSRRILENSYHQVAESAECNRMFFRIGKITTEVELRARTIILYRFSGVLAGSEEHFRLQQAPPKALRALNCEWEATKWYWRQSVGLTPDRLRDLFHLIVAMSHVDFILTYDQDLQAMIAEVAALVRFPVATVVGSMDELIEVANRHQELKF